MQVLEGLAPGAVMVECGAYWGFYSMWFCKVVPEGTAHLIEPEPDNLSFGRRNFELNGLRGTFHQAFVGAESHCRQGGVETVCLDEFMSKERIQRIDLLHADIQGYELDLLRGAARSLARGAVLFLFISTHSEELHAGCRELLQDAGYDSFVSIPPSQSFSVDGVLVACREDYRGRQFEKPSRRLQSNDLVTRNVSSPTAVT
jgi:hypothetical protein